MGRPKVAPYKKINLALPVDLVDEMDAVSNALGMSKKDLWEYAGRKFLKTVNIPGSKAKKEPKK